MIEHSGPVTAGNSSSGSIILMIIPRRARALRTETIFRFMTLYNAVCSRGCVSRGVKRCECDETTGRQRFSQGILCQVCKEVKSCSTLSRHYSLGTIKRIVQCTLQAI